MVPVPEPTRELEVERLVIREPNGGRVRAVLETAPSQDGGAPVVRLVLLDATGFPALIAEVDGAGAASLVVGPPDAASRVVIPRT